MPREQPQTIIIRERGGCFSGCLGMFALLAVIAVAGAMFLGRGGGVSGRAPVAEVVGPCRTQATELADYLAKATANGFYSFSGSKHFVDETPWTVLTHDQKVNVAIAAYCTEMAADGTGTLLLYGLHDGKVKASMINGNYFDR